MAIFRVRSQAGFTFNELMASMGLTFIALLSYSLSSVGLFREQKAADNLTTAMHLAEAKIEELKSLKTPSLVNNCPGGGDVGVGADGFSSGIFQRCWSVALSPSSSTLHRIDVTVAWQEHKPQKYQLSTLVFYNN